MNLVIDNPSNNLVSRALGCKRTKSPQLAIITVIYKLLIKFNIQARSPSPRQTAAVKPDSHMAVLFWREHALLGGGQRETKRTTANLKGLLMEVTPTRRSNRPWWDLGNHRLRARTALGLATWRNRWMGLPGAFGFSFQILGSFRNGVVFL